MFTLKQNHYETISSQDYFKRRGDVPFIGESLVNTIGESFMTIVHAFHIAGTPPPLIKEGG